MQLKKVIIGLGLLGFCSVSLAADQQGRGAQMLENLDSNGDGNVDFTEFQENGRDMVATLDSDGDNAISLEEFAQMRPPGSRNGRGPQQENEPDANRLAEREARIAERTASQFADMDLDGDGLVSTLEFQEARFLQMDQDGNGVLNASELRRRGPDGRGPGSRRGGGNRQSADNP